MHGRKNIDASGDYIYNSKNCRHCYMVNTNEDCKYVFYSSDSKDYYDVFISFLANELIYESHAIPKGNYFLRFCELCANGNRFLEYCDSCESSSYLFGCIGIRGRKYCILNKQYSQDEYERLREKIIQQMNQKPFIDIKGRVYRYGEFFPVEMSPFGYNESVAQDYFPLSKEEIAEHRYNWTDIAKHKKTPNATVTAQDLSDDIRDVDDSILNEVIECANAKQNSCAGVGAFRITKQELNFYKEHNISLPRLCPNCRQLARIKQRNPLQLWHRGCTCAGTISENKVYQNTIEHFHKTNHCPNEFETSYAPERKEIIYCEPCYQAEVA